ncbi:unnamed protein product [Rhodiola kirilowii]
MHKSWMYLSDKCDPRFSQGIMAFLEFVKQKKASNNYSSVSM